MSAGHLAWTLAHAYANPVHLNAVRSENGSAEYLDAMIKEVGRMYTATMFMRKVLQDVDVNGKKIKAGSLISITNIVGNYDDKVKLPITYRESPFYIHLIHSLSPFRSTTPTLSHSTPTATSTPQTYP